MLRAKYGSEGVGFQVDMLNSGEPAADRSFDAIYRIGDIASRKIATESHVERLRNAA